jgi:adenylate cyclase
VVDAVRCAIEVQNGMIERNAGLPPERRIEFRVGIHLGDVVEESDGDLMGDGVNIAARLEGIAKPGAICLSEQAYWQVKSRLDLAVSDLGAIQLKNIAEPVRVYSLEVGKAAQAKATKPAVAKQRSIFVLLGAGIVALIAIAGGAWYFLGANRTSTVTSNAPATRAEAAHLSIVVLPFTNLSGDPSQDYFADGITENLTTDLSRIRNSFVIARNTAFTFKGKNIPIKEISKELGVRYVLEGSVAGHVLQCRKWTVRRDRRPGLLQIGFLQVNRANLHRRRCKHRRDPSVIRPAAMPPLGATQLAGAIVPQHFNFPAWRAAQRSKRTKLPRLAHGSL